MSSVNKDPEKSEVTKDKKEAGEPQVSAPAQIVCGLVMPISEIDGCSAGHWIEVKQIITEAIEGIESPNFRVRLVSDADDSGLIHKRIVQNVYADTIVVCDVSGKNPNVMFELGMRLAFDKPVVLIKDDQTDFTFDSGVIEHLGYSRSLRYSDVQRFKSLLQSKVVHTVQASAKDPSASSFLQHFGSFSASTLQQRETTPEAILSESLNELRLEMRKFRSEVRSISNRQTLGGYEDARNTLDIELVNYLSEIPREFLSDVIANDSSLPVQRLISELSATYKIPERLVAQRMISLARKELTERIAIGKAQAG